MSKTSSRDPKKSAFLQRAERAFGRAAERIISESRQLGQKPLSWQPAPSAKIK